NVMSSISQIERSSSQIRILGMSAFSDQLCRRGLVTRGRHHLQRRSLRQLGCLADLSDAKHERATLARLRTHPHFTFMRLHNLVNDGQTESGSTFELRLKRLEDLFRHLRAHTGTSVGKTEFPVRSQVFNSNRECAALFHGP